MVSTLGTGAGRPRQERNKGGHRRPVPGAEVPPQAPGRSQQVKRLPAAVAVMADTGHEPGTSSIVCVRRGGWRERFEAGEGPTGQEAVGSRASPRLRWSPGHRMSCGSPLVLVLSVARGNLEEIVGRSSDIMASTSRVYVSLRTRGPTAHWGAGSTLKLG